MGSVDDHVMLILAMIMMIMMPARTGFLGCLFACMSVCLFGVDDNDDDDDDNDAAARMGFLVCLRH